MKLLTSSRTTLTSGQAGSVPAQEQLCCRGCVSADIKMNMHQPHVLNSNKANATLSYVRRNVASRSGEVIIGPNLALVRQHLAHGGHPCPRRTLNKPTKTQQRANKMIGVYSTGIMKTS